MVLVFVICLIIFALINVCALKNKRNTLEMINDQVGRKTEIEESICRIGRPSTYIFKVIDCDKVEYTIITRNNYAKKYNKGDTVEIVRVKKRYYFKEENLKFEQLYSVFNVSLALIVLCYMMICVFCGVAFR